MYVGLRNTFGRNGNLLYVYKGSNKPILFFKKEVDNYWRGSGVEMCPIDTNGNLDKWEKFDLI